MTDDIVARLRCYADINDAVFHPWVYAEAADEIERLRDALQRANATTEEYERKFYLGNDRIEQLEAALRPFAKWADWHDGAKGTDVERCFSKAEITVGELRAARKALEGGK